MTSCFPIKERPARNSQFIPSTRENDPTLGHNKSLLRQAMISATLLVLLSFGLATGNGGEFWFFDSFN